MAFNTGNAVPSTDARDLSDNAETLDELIDSSSISAVTRTGKVVITRNGLEKQYLFTAINGGIWDTGQTFTAFNQYMVFSGTAYKPKNSTTLPYVVGATPDTDFVEVVGNSSTAQIINDLSQAYEFPTVAAYKAFATAFPVGKVINTIEFSSGNGGGASYTIIASGTENGTNIIKNTTLSQSITLDLSSGTADVKQFGAIGDGVTNDTGAIQAAWDLGNTIKHPNTASSTYLVNDTMLIGSNTTLLFDVGVKLKLATGINKTMVENADVSNTDITIINGIFDVDEANQTTQQHCIRFDNVDNCYFERVDVRPTHFVSGPVASWHFEDCDNNTFKDCILNASAGEGLLLIGADNKVLGGDYSDNGNGSGIQASGDNLFIDGVTAKNNSGSPISVHGENVKVTNNTIVGGGIVGTNGINMGHAGDPVTNAVISGNTIRDFDGANGIRCNSASNNVVISDNVVTGMTRVSSVGIGVGDGSFDVSILNNRITACVTGIGAASTEAVVSNNVVEGCSSSGIVLSSVVGGVVSNNIAINNAGTGIVLDVNSLRCIVDSNQANSNDRAIVVSAATAGHIISNNYGHSNTTGSLTNPGGNELQGNRFSLTDELVVTFTMIASGIDITITNANIVTGSRITIVPTSTEAATNRFLYLKSQAFGSCVIGNTGGAAGATFELHIK